MQFVHQHYNKAGAINILDQAIEFEEDYIKLDIPLDGVTAGDWRITPLIPPVVCIQIQKPQSL